MYRPFEAAAHRLVAELVAAVAAGWIISIVGLYVYDQFAAPEWGFVARLPVWVFPLWLILRWMGTHAVPRWIDVTRRAPPPTWRSFRKACV